MTTYRQRKDQAGRLRDDKPCPKCGHRYGSHRDIPSRCGECSCVVTLAEWTAWKKVAR